MSPGQHIRPIKSEESDAHALSRVEELMGKDLSEEERDELEVLAILIERYEEDEFPMDAPTPVDAIKFRMEQMNFSQSDLAPIIGSRAKVSEILSGKRPLTLNMVRALNSHLGIPAEVLIGEGNRLPSEPISIDLDRFPIREMAKRGWIEAGKANLKDRLEEIVRGLITACGGAKAAQPLFRQGVGSRANAKADAHALQAWCLHVIATARRAGLEGKYAKGAINEVFLRDVAKLSVFDEGPKLAREMLAKSGIALVFASHLPKTYLDGAALTTVDGVPVVGMTVRYDRIDNFWFCLLHELAHLGWHFAGDDPGIFIDDLQLSERGRGPDNEREDQADRLAQDALIPPKMWEDHPARLSPTVRHVLSLAQQASVHPAVVAGRIRHEKRNYRLLSQFVGGGEVSRALGGKIS